jgi:tetratricopeptide (TPR) repeat protein
MMSEDEELTARESVNELEDARDHEGVVTYLSELLIRHPGEAWAYHTRAMALLELSRDAEALPDFDRALDLDHRFPGTRAWRARTHAKLGHHLAAANDFLYVAETECHGSMGVSPLTWADCARQFVMAGQRDRAIDVLENYLANYAPMVRTYARYETTPLRILAELLLEKGEIERAAALKEQARSSPHRVPAGG